MDVRIRRAERADCPRLLELVRELAVYEQAPDAVTVDPAHFEESGFGHQPVWWAFVAAIDDTGSPSGERIVAFALYYVRYSTWKGQAMYLEDIIVTEAMRGRGIGAMLFDRLKTEARDTHELAGARMERARHPVLPETGCLPRPGMDERHPRALKDSIPRH